MPFELGLPELEQPRLLWVGDVIAPTGLARVTHNVLAYLWERYDVHVLGINATGDPHEYPYRIYPAGLGGDLHGVGRYRRLVERLRPDVVLINHDPWIVARFLALAQDERLVAYLPIDGANIKDGAALNRLDLALFYTRFGEQEARAGGYGGPAAMIPHGVNLDLYHPVDRREARERLGLGQLGDSYIVGNVNRNAPRKRIDLTIMAFARWVHEARLPDTVYLWLHMAKLDRGWDIVQLARFYDIEARLILTSHELTSFNGIAEADMHLVYAAFDVQVSTTLGEGWGLTTMEGMACGVPQLAPDYSALGEWAREAAALVPCTSYMATPERVNTIGGIVDQDGLVQMLQFLYESAEMRAELRTKGLALVSRPAYRWAAIAAQFDTALREVLASRTPRDGQPAGGDAARVAVTREGG